MTDTCFQDLDMVVQILFRHDEPASLRKHPSYLLRQLDILHWCAANEALRSIGPQLFDCTVVHQFRNPYTKICSKVHIAFFSRYDSVIAPPAGDWRGAT